MSKATLFYNCSLLRDHQLIKDDLWVQGGQIIDPSLEGVEYRCDESVDCKGCIISPGFIDLKMNGGFGVDFSTLESPATDIAHVAANLPRTGVTSFCPTVVTTTKETYHSSLPHFRQAEASTVAADTKGATLLGVHLDGPFISAKKKGAHSEALIQSFDNGYESVKEIYGDLSNVSIMTLAPELDNAPAVIQQLTKQGVKISLGHSACSLAMAETAVAAGASMITHLFNAMPEFHHRDPSLVGLLASDNIPDHHPVYFGLIADGNHTHPAALRMAYRIAPETLLLVTDGMAPLGLGLGEFSMGSKTVIVEGDSPKCYLKGTDILSGSVAPMDFCVRNFMKHTSCSLPYALEAATLHPAQAMNLLGRKGTLNAGCDADFVLLDANQLSVQATYIAGKKVFDASAP